MSGRYIIANWKGRLSQSKGLDWIRKFAKERVSLAGSRVIIAPPCISLTSLQKQAKDESLNDLHWAMQDISPFPPGGYTGAIPAALVKDLVGYVIIGHPERRRYFHETEQEVANKAAEVVEAGMIPIICMNREIAAKQIAALNDDVIAEMITAYTPSVSGQNKAVAESPEEVAKAAKYIAGLSGNRPVVYGGGVKQANMSQYEGLSGIAGVLVGEAGLDPDEFAGIVRAVSKG